MEKNETTAMDTQPLSDKKLMEFLDIAGIGTQLTPNERKKFVEIAQAYQLNPFKREIHCTTYGVGPSRKTSIITGYEVYRKRADRTGDWDGEEFEYKSWAVDKSISIKIYRKSKKYPICHTVWFDEVCQRTKEGHLNSIWAKMPKFMTKKVLIAQSYRLAFPDEMGGLPYTADELPQAEIKAYKIPAAKITKAAKPAAPNLPSDILETLESATNKVELKALCRKIGADDVSLQPTLNEYYKTARFL